MPHDLILPYKTPAAPAPVKWDAVGLPLIMVLPFMMFSLLSAFPIFPFFEGSAIAWMFLLFGCLVAPATIVFAIANCIRYRHEVGAVVISMFSIPFAATAFVCELWRLSFEWN